MYAGGVPLCDDSSGAQGAGRPSESGDSYMMMAIAIAIAIATVEVFLMDGD